MAARYSGATPEPAARPFEVLPVRQPEFRTLANSFLGHEYRAVFVPRLGFFGGPIHRFEDGRLVLRGGQQFAQRALLEGVLIRQLDR